MERTRSDSDGSWFRRRRLPGRLGVVGISRLLAFQVIQVGLVVVLVQGVAAAALGSAVGVLAIVVVFGRWRGRWATEGLGLWLRYRARRGAVAGPPADPRLAALGQLVPDLVVDEIPGPDDTRLGMGSDGAGWFAVLEVESGGVGGPTTAGVEPPVPLAALARLAAEAGPAGAAGAVIQVVSHTVATAANGAQQLSQPPPPAQEPQRLLWVAVRLDADQLAGATVDTPEPGTPDVPNVPAVLAELTRRTRRALTRRGLAARVLDPDGLIDALIYSCDLVPIDGGGRQCQESWRAWYSHHLVHRCYWLRRWPDPDRGTALLAGLADLPGARVSIALLLSPRPETGDADLRCLVRLSAPPDRHQLACHHAEQVAARWGGQLFPLDGEHAPAVYGSAPSGGGAR